MQHSLFNQALKMRHGQARKAQETKEENEGSRINNACFTG